jgi:hypothetical protein
MAAHLGQITFSAATIRRVGLGLVAYGALGLILVTAALVGGWSGITRIDAAMGSVAEASATLEAVADAFAGFDASLESATRSADHAAVASRDAATAAAGLADAMSLSIFGAQPLLPLANDFRRQATDLRAVAGDLDQLAASLTNDRSQIKGIHDHVRALSARVATVGGGAAGAGVAALLVALLVWIGTQAAGALLVGIMLLRRRPHRRA